MWKPLVTTKVAKRVHCGFITVNKEQAINGVKKIIDFPASYKNQFKESWQDAELGTSKAAPKPFVLWFYGILPMAALFSPWIYSEVKEYRTNHYYKECTGCNVVWTFWLSFGAGIFWPFYPFYHCSK